MPTEPGNPHKSSADALEDLQSRVKAAQSKRAKKHVEPSGQSMLGIAWRISTELVIAVLVGTLLGFGIDKLTGTSPWITILGLVVGTAAGLRNTFRLVEKMDAEAKAIKTARDEDTSSQI